MSDETKGGIRLSARRLFSAGLICLMLSGLSHPGASPAGYDSSLGWREAAPGYKYSFPNDHASHPDNRIEWWYYTGNLETKTGRRFGYQLTFFRLGVLHEPANASRWALRDLYMAHFAISDIDRRSFRSFERINRAGVGWAGADALDPNPRSEAQSKTRVPVRVWNEDWETRIEGGDHQLYAFDEDWSLDLKLTTSTPAVIHGENGISQKGSSAGNASHYYSMTRLQSSGRLVVDGESFEVSGLSWMDHEFGTSFLNDEQIGWDWFSIQLEDGRDLMLFQIRRRDGSIDPHSSGTLVEAGGGSIHLAYEDFSLAPDRTWRSTNSGAIYPVGWRIDLPRYNLNLTVSAAFEDQELRTPESTGVTYWEGSVSIEDASLDKKIRGRGYLEMTGYAGPSMGAMLR